MKNWEVRIDLNIKNVEYKEEAVFYFVTCRLAFWGFLSWFSFLQSIGLKILLKFLMKCEKWAVLQHSVVSGQGICMRREKLFERQDFKRRCVHVHFNGEWKFISRECTPTNLKQMSDAIMHMRNLIPYIRRKAAIKILEN